MSKAGALDLATSVGGEIDKNEVLSAVEKYEKYHCYYGGEEKERNDNYADMVLDVGCGIGGPLREIAQFSMTSVTGLNISEYQIRRAKALNRKVGLDKACDFVKADFMKMPFPDNSFDAVYAIEATCHAADVAEIELGNGLPDIRGTGQCLEALKQAGYEVIWDIDLAADSPVPWYLPLEQNQFSLTGFRLTAAGRFITRNMLKGLEYIGLAPTGSRRVHDFLEKAADGLVNGGRKRESSDFIARTSEKIGPHSHGGSVYETQSSGMFIFSHGDQFPACLISFLAFENTSIKHAE
ncbi:hypothetical protein RHMOL_Rhmol07G0070500 [Rhododendron molle]|uniref:Uncharacterized protein n=1 Tax=Rhododendron molle TaxID=49168 RepID=A0ACC0MY92_RHOML|nr:hypothetical protein RHMOL_Rhmol07G0070500 [Rhododendron molle]